MKKLLFLGAVLGASAFAHAFNLEFSAGVWNQDPSGYVRYPRNTGDTIDLKNTLGLGKEKKPFGRLKIELPIVPNIYLGYLPSTFKGENNIPYEITYGNFTFTTTVNVKTDINLQTFSSVPPAGHMPRTTIPYPTAKVRLEDYLRIKHLRKRHNKTKFRELSSHFNPHAENNTLARTPRICSP